MINRGAKGYRVEKRCYEALKAEGFTLLWKTIRHKFLNIDLFGVFDVVAANAEGLRFIQCKSGYYSKGNAEELRARIRAIQLPPNCVKEIWCWHDREGWRKEVVE